MKKISLIIASCIAFTNIIANAQTTTPVVGNLSGDLTVNAGKLSYTLPIVTPAGIHGLKPDISISYTQSTGAGLLGAGFTLSATSNISRCNPSQLVDGFKSGIELNKNARFCMNGQKLIAISGLNGASGTEYRAELDNNDRYFSQGGANYTPAYWEKQSADGYKYKYEQINGANTKFSAWMLTEKRDHFGNTITYNYNSGLMPTLNNISYSGYTINFIYEDREQPIGQYKEGSYYELSKRLAKITINRNTDQISEYRFTYESIIPVDGVADLPLEKLKRLASVEKCYGENGSAGCLKPVSFDYMPQPDSSTPLDTAEDRTLVVPREHYAATDNIVGMQVYERPSYTAGDINNDGYADFCYYKLNTGIMCALSNNGIYQAPAAWTGDLGYVVQDSTATEDEQDEGIDYKYFSQINLIDLNNDSYLDFCLSDDTGIRCGLNNNGNGFSAPTYWTNALKHDGTPTFGFINDDNLPDICGLNDDLTNYSCLAGTGTSFTGSIISLNNIVDNQEKLSWTYEHCTPDDIDLGICSNPGQTSNEKEVSMPTAQWIDIDGDIDNDLCWLSAKDAGLFCIYQSTDDTDQSIVLSAPQKVYDFDYQVLSSINISSNTIYSITNHVYDEAADDVIDNARRFTVSYRLADLNADLLPDICYTDQHKYYCAINNGNGFETASLWIDIAGIFSDNTTSGGNQVSHNENYDLSSLVTIKLEDMNGDGLADFCIIEDQLQSCAYNQIGSFGDLQARQAIAADIDTNVDSIDAYDNFVRQVFGLKTTYVTGVSNFAYGNILNVHDLNGDGFGEFCYRSITGILCTSNDNYAPAALLTGVTDSVEQTTEVVYNGLLSGDLYEWATSIPVDYVEKPSNQWVVDTVISSTGVLQGDTPIVNSQSYKYGGLLLDSTLGISGFTSVSITQNERDTSTRMTLSVERHLVGQQLLIEEFIGDKRLKTKQNQFSIADIGNGTYRMRLDSVEEKQYALDGITLVSTSTTNNSNYDIYGFPQQSIAVKTMAEDGENVITTTTTAYHHNIQDWLIARPDYQTVIHEYQGNIVSREVGYVYQNGTLIRQIMQPNAINASTIEYVYDIAGNTQQEITSGSGQQRSVTKTFDSLGRVTSISNALNQTESFTYHPTCAGVATHTDIAGKVTNTGYDFACRKISTDAPDDNAVTWSYEWATEADNALENRPINHPYTYRNPIAYKVTETQAYGPWSTSYYDVSGRVVRTESLGFSSQQTTRTIINDTVYDRFGRKTATNIPYYRTNNALATPSWVTVEHDIASRIKHEHKTGADGNPLTTTYTYDKNTVTLSYSDFSKTTQTGVFGKPVNINENGLIVTFEYDAIGNVLRTVRNGIANEITYDDRGFQQQQIDPAMGTWTYQYNAFGELITQTDAKNQTTSFTYDVLGRAQTRTTPEGITSWYYYNSGHGIGQLQREQGVSATKEWTYDSLGRVITETLTANTQQFTTSFAYDNYSRLIKTTNPDGLEVHNAFDTTGEVNHVSIPAEQYQGFNFELLQNEYDVILLNLIQIETNIGSLEQQMAYHLSKSQEYQEKAIYYTSLYHDVTGQIQVLQNLAAQHEALAESYRQAAEDLRNQAEQYRQLYGNRTFRYVGIENGKYKFRTSWCTKHKRVLGIKRCRVRQTRFVYVDIGNINPIAGEQGVYFYEERDVDVCTSNNYYDEYDTSSRACTTVRRGAPSCGPSSYDEYTYSCTSMRPHELWTKAAEGYERLRNIELEKAEAYRDQITTQPTTLVYMPVEVTEDTFIPIGIDITVMIPATITYMKKQWTNVSLQVAADYYQQQIDYYNNLAQLELNNYNSLSSQVANLWTDFDEQETARNNFEESLASAGLADDNGEYTVTDILDEALANQAQWQNNQSQLTLWSATMRDATGQIATELFGNGLYTKREIDARTGLVTSIETSAYSAISPLRKIDYTFNARGLITHKNDTTNALNTTFESYGYDAQGRLRSWSFDQTLAPEEADIIQNNLMRTYDYDDHGNMTWKTGAGIMYYNTANQLTSRTPELGSNVTYTYDANGNMQNGDGRSYSWTSFNKASQIIANGQTVNFSYDASDKRVIKQTANQAVYYVNPSYEKVVKQENGTTVTIHRHNIWNGHDVVATLEKREDSSEEVYTGDEIAYYHRDHLGNGELVTGVDMNIISQRFYTPYGEHIEDILQAQSSTSQLPQYADTVTEDYNQLVIDNNESISAINLLSDAQISATAFSGELRGFTSHEEIKEVGLVNMNARLYDPVIGRFVSADSMIPEASQPLDYNRYAYVRNNPISYRDPTGHWVFAAAAFFVAAHLSDNVQLQMLSAVLLSAALGGPNGILSPGAFAGPCAAISWSAAAASAGTIGTIVTYLQTGDLSAAAEAGAWAAVSAGVANEVGHGNGGLSHFEDPFTKAAVHGLTQGAISELRGDDFATGFISGLASSVSGHFSQDVAETWKRTSIAMLSGYFAAEATGGNGVQAAATAAIVFLYNDLAYEKRKSTGALFYTLEDTIEVSVDQFNNGGNADFEFHVYDKGDEIGVYKDGKFIAKHGHDGKMPTRMTKNALARLNGIYIFHIRKAGLLPDKGKGNIKGIFRATGQALKVIAVPLTIYQIYTDPSSAGSLIEDTLFMSNLGDSSLTANPEPDEPQY